MTTGSKAPSTAKPATSQSATCKSPCPCPTCKHLLPVLRATHVSPSVDDIFPLVKFYTY